MLRFENWFCSDCARTQRFLDLGPALVCQACSKQLWRPAAAAPPVKPAAMYAAYASPDTGRVRLVPRAGEYVGTVFTA